MHPVLAEHHGGDARHGRNYSADQPNLPLGNFSGDHSGQFRRNSHRGGKLERGVTSQPPKDAAAGRNLNALFLRESHGGDHHKGETDVDRTGVKCG